MVAIGAYEREERKTERQAGRQTDSWRKKGRQTDRDREAQMGIEILKMMTEKQQ